ncbi:MAG: hypothetical protein IJ856_04655, partial [Candidatus Methanomethylophilaceae archaeon]|nr:hypothetical protein [Candidatus Methanomethylophilaceae archaeon]
AESLACGVPCVMYSLPYLRITREGSGFVQVPQRDTHAAAVEVCKLLENQSYRTDLGRQGKEYIGTLARFDHEEAWKVIFSDMEKPIGKEMDPVDDLMWNTLFQFYRVGVERKNRAYDDLKKKLADAESVKRDEVQNKNVEQIQPLPPDVRKNNAKAVDEEPKKEIVATPAPKKTKPQTEQTEPVPDILGDIDARYSILAELLDDDPPEKQERSQLDVSAQDLR